MDVCDLPPEVYSFPAQTFYNVNVQSNVTHLFSLAQGQLIQIEQGNWGGFTISGKADKSWLLAQSDSVDLNADNKVTVAK